MKLVLTAIVLVALALAAAAQAAHEVDLEAGWVFPGRNDVRIPGDAGTKLSLTEELSADAFAAWRVRYTWTWRERHSLGVLVAPLTLEADGALDRDADFNGVTFPAGTPLDATFRFNSYRAGYRYWLWRGGTFRLAAGLTLKVRDAEIQLRGGGVSTEKTDLGVVPLIGFRAEWLPADRFAVVLDGDALAAPQGRAEDVLLAARYALTDALALKAGYRILEGGADNDTVYTFSLFQYAVAGVEWQF